MMKRRPSWSNLQKLSDSLTLASFVIARRPLVWKGRSHTPGSALPSDMPAHRVRQYYGMRRVDASQETLSQLENAHRIATCNRLGVRAQGMDARGSNPSNLSKPVDLPRTSIPSPSSSSKQSSPRPTSRPIVARVPGISDSASGYTPTRPIKKEN